MSDVVVDPSGFRALAAGFIATRGSANTRAAYGRDLAILGAALGVVPEEAEAPPFGVESDPGARLAAEQMAVIPPGWWQEWRDGLDGRPSSRARRVAAVRAFCRWWSRGLDLPNPVEDLRPPVMASRSQESLSREVSALTPSQVRRLCDAAAAMPGAMGLRTHALIEVLYGCGLRAAEAAGLDMSGLHLDDPDDPYVVVLGKGGRHRAVAVPVVARGALTHYLANGRPELRARDVTARPSQSQHRDADAVFLGARGRRIGRSDVWREVQKVADRAGLLSEGVRVFPHALRHSCGTHLVQAGVDIRYVQAHLGHASPVTTELYTHITASHLRDDFDRAHPRARRR
jgi:integrase/recombinase XerD